MATSLTIAVFDEPHIVAIVESHGEADRLWARWARLRYQRGAPIGGAWIEGLTRCDHCRTFARVADALVFRSLGTFCGTPCAEQAMAAITTRQFTEASR